MSEKVSKIEAQIAFRKMLRSDDAMREKFNAAFPIFASDFMKVDDKLSHEELDSVSGGALAGGSSQTTTKFMDWDADHPNGQCIYAISPKKKTPGT